MYRQIGVTDFRSDESNTGGQEPLWLFFILFFDLFFLVRSDSNVYIHITVQARPNDSLMTSRDTRNFFF